MDTIIYSYDNLNKKLKELNHIDHQKRSVGNNFTTSLDIRNMSKNAYPNILPLEHSLVRLNDSTSPYINANFISTAAQLYIGTQAPLENTIDDFWNMIWQTDSRMIINLTETADYLVDKSIYGNLYVEYLDVKEFHDTSLKVLKLVNQQNFNTKTIYYIHYPEWEDNMVPDRTSFANLIKVVNMTEELAKMSEKTPIVVHCKAGIGRTGVFIAIHSELKIIPKENKLDIVRTVSKMREYRSRLVHTLDQFMFCQNFLIDSIVQKRT